ncbi:heavy-metal-associated domain-containing protein [Porticoccaceae bacterium LTM1]|nr:heavy-metal-associated domain-containing protein [Porticoccaceae bacterium LTM1]
MKKIVTVLFSCLLAGIVNASDAMEETPAELLATQRATANELISETSNKVVMTVSGMYCPNCAAGVGDEVKKLDFVIADTVKVDSERALLVVDLKTSGKVDEAALADAVRNAGYQPVRCFRYADGKVNEKMVAKH